MKLHQIILILENKIDYLNQQKLVFINAGDLQRIVEIELEVNEIQIALQKLKS